VCANGNDESFGENFHLYILVVNAITPYSCTIKLQYILLGDYWECVLPGRLPVLISYELRPPWEQHLRYVPHRVRKEAKFEKWRSLSCLPPREKVQGATVMGGGHLQNARIYAYINGVYIDIM